MADGLGHPGVNVAGDTVFDGYGNPIGVYGSNGYNRIVSTGTVRDTSQDAISKLAKELDLKLSDDTKDYLYQYYLQRKNDEWAYQKQIDYDNSRYQRTVADLKAAGLNPFLALQSLSPSSSNVNAGSITSGSITSRANTQNQNNTDIARGIISVLGMIAGAIIMALA